MKNALLTFCILFCFIASAQNYEEQWKTVADFELDGRVKSAAEEVDKIYTAAKKDINEPQIIKAFLYRAKYIMVLEEDAQTKVINDVRKEKESLSIPSNALLEGIYAKILTDFYGKYSYRNDRPAKYPSLLGKWSNDDIKSEIDNAHKKSLANREILYNTPLSKYEAVLELNPVLKNTNRSLYDFLAEAYLSPNDYGYNLPDNISNTELVFKETADFLRFSIADSIQDPIKDKIIFLQQVEQFYAAKKDTNSLYRSVLRRLDYIRPSYNGNDNETYISTLLALSENWKGNTFAFDARLMLAKRYKLLANKEQHRDYLQKAVVQLNEIIVNSRLTDAAVKAVDIKNTIVNQQAYIETEKYPTPLTPSLAKVKFKNTDSLHISIFRVPTKLILSEKTSYNLLEETIKLSKAYLEKTYAMPIKNDFFQYETEIILPPLEQGAYILVAEPADKQPERPTQKDFAVLHVTKITITEEPEDNAISYQVHDRASGKPVKGAEIKYLGVKYRTDKNGSTKITPATDKDKKMEAVIATFKKDTVTTSQNYFYNLTSENHDVSVDLYLDRAIYRPGQTLYFKGIATQNINGNYSVLTNTYISIYIEDTDDEEIKKYRLKTNEFGSFTGEFTIPKNVITGRFKIQAEQDEEYKNDVTYDKEKKQHPFWDYVDFSSGYTFFDVEEYKRPGFEIVFDPVKDIITLGSKAYIKGNTQSFSGAAVAGAKIEYTIDRKSYTYKPNYQHREAFITEGVTTTDELGNFTIEFTADADPEFNPENLPLFTYKIKVSVTDVSGETQMSDFNVKAGYHSIAINTYAQLAATPKSRDFITVQAKNLNNETTPITGVVKIYRLKSEPVSLTKRRPWPEPEIQMISKEEFTRNFPYIPYTDIQNIRPDRIELVYSQNVNTGDKENIQPANFDDWESGKYEVEFTATDPANKKETAANGYFTFLKDENDTAPEVFSYKIKNKNFAQDGFADLKLNSSLKELYVNIQAYYFGKKIYANTIAITKNTKNIKIPIKESYEGDISIEIDYIWQNEFFGDQFTIKAGTKKKLDIIATSISNKLLPGKTETWSFSIKGNEKETAEMLASMYDMSLDQFSYDSWQYPAYNYRTPHHSYKRSYNSQRIYIRYSNLLQEDRPGFNASRKDRINYFGFNINNTNLNSIRSKEHITKKIIDKSGFIFKGNINDSSGPLTGAVVVGKYWQAITDADGFFSIPVLKDEKLTVLFPGYKLTYLDTNSSQNAIILEKDPLAAQNIVALSYGNYFYEETISRKSAAAVTTLTVEDVEDRANASVLQSLQGQVAGLNIGTGSGQPGADSTIILRGVNSINGNVEPLFVIDGIPVNEDDFRSINQNEIASFSILKDAAATSIYGNRGANGVIVITTYKGINEERQELEKVQTRKNLTETVFFYPQLLTDKDGSVSFSFTSPEALTQWKLRMLAHNKNAVSGFFENIAVTQKDLMVTPNMPRFFREQDTIVIIAKINNMTPEVKAGNAMLQLYNASTMETIDALALNSDNMKPFTLDAKGSTTVSWKIRIPEGVEGIQYKVLAKSGNFTDGEESIIPVLSNRILVTESIPLWVRENTSKEYTLENLKNTTSSTLKNHKLVFEYTSNPAWIALQSLPYLMEYEYNCSEQIFSRFYANAIAAHMVDSVPKIKTVFDEWKKTGKPVSKLEQNEELKSLIASESPWMLDAKNEEENKNRMALLFESQETKSAMLTNLKQLEGRQNESGAFSWFEGGDDNEFITKHILAGFGHLLKMEITELEDSVKWITKEGVSYIDKRFIEQDNTIKDIKKNNYRVSYNDLHYLYARSFYTDIYPVTDSLKMRIKKYTEYSKENWLSYSLYQKAMAALVLNRFGEEASAKKILVSLKETATNNPEWGMYWKENKPGYYWYNSPIETQALIIEAFTEIDNDTQSTDAMKVWLIKNKQNKSWPTTKSTTEAIYALLMKGTDWLSVKDNTAIKLGNEQELAKKIAESEKEAETGYTKLVWNGSEVTKSMATVSIHNTSAVPGYGGFYWQYFEDIDKIQPAEQGLIKIGKELFIKNNTNTVTEYKPVTNESDLKVGDVIMVRLTLEVQEDLEYVHLKDVRASAFEPVDVISSYERNGGLSYYKSTRDAATHFFFDRVNKGTFILEYEVKVNNAGTFSGGISTMQSMYAPEFSGNSGGGNRIKINQ